MTGRNEAYWETLKYDAAANLLDRRRGEEESNQNLIRFNQLLSFRGLKYSYDEHGRTRSKQTDSGTQHYHYDAEYRLDRNGKPCNRTTFLWDGLQMIQESSADKRQSLYLYIDEGSYESLARIDRNGNQEQHIYYFHTDLNGMPEEPTDEAGEIIWECSYQLWGKSVQEIAHRETQQNLRYQGQYLDRETELHYNSFRYYDPDTGRFTQPDPIGLAGELNLYQYAPNAFMWIDPWGWAKCGTARKKRMPSEKNKHLDHSRTTHHPDGSITFYDHKGRAVTYDKHGNPDFRPYKEAEVKSTRFKGDRRHDNDNKIANEKIGYKGDKKEDIYKAPPGKVWHHVDKDTLILLDAELHYNFPHTGGASELIHG